MWVLFHMNLKSLSSSLLHFFIQFYMYYISNNYKDVCLIPKDGSISGCFQHQQVIFLTTWLCWNEMCPYRDLSNTTKFTFFNLDSESFIASSVSATTSEPTQPPPCSPKGGGVWGELPLCDCSGAGWSCQPAVFKCQLGSLDQFAFQWHHLPSNPCLSFRCIHSPGPPLHKPAA